MNLSLLSSSAALVLAGTASAGTVWTVDDDGPADYTKIQDAIAAAADGDTILVRDGIYSGQLVLDNHALEIVVDTDGLANLSGSVTIRNLGAGKSVAVRGAFEVYTVGTSNPILVENCAGPVFLEDLEAAVGNRFRIIDSAAVTLVDCVATDSAALIDDRLDASGSNVYAFGCKFRGANHEFSNGLRGARVRDGFLFASNCTFRGSNGSDGMVVGGGPSGAECAIQPSDGADGLLVDEGATVVTQACTLIGGSGGSAGAPCTPASDGLGVNVLSGSHDELDGTPHGYSTDTPVRSGESATLTFEGEEGELAIFAFSLGQLPIWAPTLPGTLVPAFPSLMTIGAIPAGGILALEVPIQIPAGLTSLTLFEQAAFVNASLEVTLAHPRVGVILSDTL